MDGQFGIEKNPVDEGKAKKYLAGETESSPAYLEWQGARKEYSRICEQCDKEREALPKSDTEGREKVMEKYRLRIENARRNATMTDELYQDSINPERSKDN